MKTILCYGDSNTYGYNPVNGMRYAPDIRWTGRLQALLGSEYRVIEEGCNGRTTVYEDPVECWKSGLSYLRPCLNSHKPIDIVILMLGSNDLKEVFHATPEEIASGAGRLVDVIQEFTKEKQGYCPQIILISPPQIGTGIATSPFRGSFQEDSIARSGEFPKYYKRIAEEKGCIFLDAAEWVESSEEDSLHLSPEAHAVLAEKLVELVK
jgi:lysophospholipase L1-like esterase